MKKYLSIICLLTLVIASCKKDLIIEEHTLNDSSRLNFQSVQDFETLMTKIHDEKDIDLKESVLE